MDLDAYTEGDRFDISGPAHLMRKSGDGSSQIIPIDWGNKEHCRCIAACLVNGTYIIEQERTSGWAALAPPWWESFHFSLHAELVDERGDTFGAVFEHPPPAPGTHPHQPCAPRYVVAFRGTMPKRGDLYHDWKVLADTLMETNRFLLAQQAVAELVAAGDGVVWLTGHSLGASLALELGRAMMLKRGLNLPTILFNPPQVSLEPVLNLFHVGEETKRKVAAVADMAKGLVALALTTESETKHTEEMFERLSPWMPELYVHDDDPICQGFIKYFEQRRRRHTVEGSDDDEDDLLSVAVAAQSFSLRGMFSSAVLRREKKEPHHLLPSATLWRTKSAPSDSDVLPGHGIRQWWKQDDELKLITRQYSYP